MSFMIYGSLDFEMNNLMASTRLFRSSSLILINFLQFLFNNLCCPFFFMLYTVLLETLYLLVRVVTVCMPVLISLSISSTVSIHNFWFFSLENSELLIKSNSFLLLGSSTLSGLPSSGLHNINSLASISRQ